MPFLSRSRRLLVITLTILPVIPGYSLPEGERIYWADVEGIHWSSLRDDTTQRIISTDTRRPSKIAVDGSRGKIYWSDNGGLTLQWSDLDGSNLEMFPESNRWAHGSRDIALDPQQGKIYSLGQIEGPHSTSDVYRANLDGSGHEWLLNPYHSASAFTVDPERGYVYLVSEMGGNLLRYDLSGSGSEYDRVGFIGIDVAFDVAGNKLYWSQRNAIRRSNPDGSNAEDVLSGLDGTPVAIALDPEGGRVYWISRPSQSACERVECFWKDGDLVRANLDGSGMEYLVAGMELVGFDLDLVGGKIYWSDARGTLHRANLDGTEVEDLFAPEVRAPYSVALDLGDERIYWSDFLAGSIHRAGLDGSNPEFVVGGLESPKGVALGGNRIYWADPGAGKIQSANLDGSDKKDIATAVAPEKVALNLIHRKVYWTEKGEEVDNRIHRVDMDGSSAVEDFPVEGHPNGIAVDAAAGKLYWTWNDRYLSGLRRSNLDGKDVEDIVSSIDFGNVEHGESFYYFSAVQLAGGRQIYWASTYLPPYIGGGSPLVYINVLRTASDGSGVVEEVVELGVYANTYDRPLARATRGSLLGNSLALAFPPRQTSVAATNDLPLSTTLGSSYPNPFNGSSLISYALSAPGPVTLVVYNTLGQPVRTLVDQIQTPGSYNVRWRPAETLASGVYLYRLTTPEAVLTRRLTFLR